MGNAGWWMGPADEALQRPLPDGMLQVVARGAKRDDGPGTAAAMQSGLLL